MNLKDSCKLIIMENKTASKTVRLSPKNKHFIEQSVDYDDKNNWVCVKHAGNDLSMSLENWKSLVDLTDSITSTDTNDKITRTNHSISRAGTCISPMDHVKLLADEYNAFEGTANTDHSRIIMRHIKELIKDIAKRYDIPLPELKNFYS